MKSGRRSTIIETWMESGYYRHLVVGEARKAFRAVQWMNGGAHYWRSPDGIMEAQTVGGVQKDIAQGRKPEEPRKGRPFTNFSWGYFILNRQDSQVSNDS